MDTFKNSYYEILDSLKDKVNENEIKSLEDYLVGLIEETKDRSTKLYAKRIDVNKNIKTLELQIKEIIEVYVKKLDTGDNWILAKKPINSYTCASCEAYLGNLNKKNDDYFENKDYEKINNIGNGFSRILNLININNDVDYRSNKNKINDMNLTGNLINNNNNNNINEKTKILTDYNSKKEYESDTENINKKTNIKKKKFHHYIQSQALGNSNIQYFKEKPKIKIEVNNNDNGILSDDDRKNKKQNNKEDLNKKNIDGPKVMKIIKKTKI
jgi:hypothetical protein